MANRPNALGPSVLFASTSNWPILRSASSPLPGRPGRVVARVSLVIECANVPPARVGQPERKAIKKDHTLQ